MKNKQKTFRKTLAFIFILIGIGVITFPFIRRSVNDYKNKKEYKDFVENTKEDKNLDEKAKAYNEKIKTTTQAMVDPFDDANIETENILEDKDQVFAYLSIPKLDKYLPIYLDASLDHISKGVAQISGTDIPIGGKGTRSVIAGHRGWWGDTMFLYIDDLNEGDSIFVERGGEKLEYKVTTKEVIDPYDWDALKPYEDQDMITLLTCSPFLPPRPDRLLVNATRPVEEEKAVSQDMEKEEEEDFKEAKTQAPKSQKSKVIETLTYVIAIGGSIAFLVVLVKFIKYLIG